MSRLRVLACSLLLVAAPALAAEPHVTTIPDGAAPAEPGGADGVPCDVLIRYDDGSDDQLGYGWTLGLGQRLGIIAQAPPAPSGFGWLIQSAGFYAEFWVVPGDVNVQVTSVADAANTTTETIYVDSGGTWETALSAPIVVAPDEEFSVMLCGGPGTWGVTGEDTADPDGRSYYSGTACSPDQSGFDPPNDLMIWACVTQVALTPQVIPTMSLGGFVLLGLALAGLGAYWLASRRRSRSLPA